MCRRVRLAPFTAPRSASTSLCVFGSERSHLSCGPIRGMAAKRPPSARTAWIGLAPAAMRCDRGLRDARRFHAVRFLHGLEPAHLLHRQFRFHSFVPRCQGSSLLVLFLCFPSLTSAARATPARIQLHCREHFITPVCRRGTSSTTQCPINFRRAAFNVALLRTTRQSGHTLANEGVDSRNARVKRGAASGSFLWPLRIFFIAYMALATRH